MFASGDTRLRHGHRGAISGSRDGAGPPALRQPVQRKRGSSTHAGRPVPSSEAGRSMARRRATRERSVRALVLEPEAGARRRLAAALGARGHPARACSSVDEAWKAYEQERPALALLNWTGAEGPELCRRIRATPAGRHCLILATGLNNHGTHIESALDAGADD